MTAFEENKQPRHAILSNRDTLLVTARVLLPTLAIGVIKRRKRMMALSARQQWNRNAIRYLQRLRQQYDSDLVRLRIPGRAITVVLTDKYVGELLRGIPLPFSPSTKEKRAALRHFQPHGVLISRGKRRALRREINETALQPTRPLHELAKPWSEVIHRETTNLWTQCSRHGQIDWDIFNITWWNVIRSIVFGANTSKEHEITDMLTTLRYRANWAYLLPQRRSKRLHVNRLIAAAVRSADTNSLAGKLREMPEQQLADTAGQIPHWLFAFDAAIITSYRTMALLAQHPAKAERAAAEIASIDVRQPQQLPYLRACVLESLRLWPTTPALLRESESKSLWGRKNTTFLIFTPFFHRDDETLPYANNFEPQIWLNSAAARNPALVPFSAGPGICPGRNLVEFTTTMMLANLWRPHRYQLSPQSLAENQWKAEEIPSNLNFFNLVFTPR